MSTVGVTMTEEAIRERRELLCTKYDLIELFLTRYGVPIKDMAELMTKIFITAFGSIHTLDDINDIEVYLFAMTERVVKEHFGYEESKGCESVLERLKKRIVEKIKQKKKALA